MFNGEERIITIPGYKIAAKEWGTKDGIPTIALHGWIDNAASFDFLAPLLPDLHILAIDSPGCGLSSHRGPGSIPSVVDEVFFILQMTQSLGWEKFHILGHSRGGVIGQLIAAGAPDRVESLILLDILGMLMASGTDMVDILRTSIKNLVYSPLSTPSVYPDLDKAARGRMASSIMNYESAMALTERGTSQVPGGYQWSFDRRELAFSTPLRFTQEMVLGFLSGIQAPTCVILAEEGYFKGDKGQDLLLSKIKNHALHWVPGYHYVHMDDPQIVANIINQFIKK
jgi:pimeloyl-ACP methyl ester carboxylesterase